MGHDPASLKGALLKPALLIALALPLLAAGMFMRHHAGTIIGPLAIAVDEGGTRVAVARGGHVYHLDADGASRSVDAGLLDPAARHAGLAFVGNELFASPDPDGDLLRCSDDACSLFSEDTYAPRGAVHVFAEGNRLWFSETDTERVQRYFADGRRIDMPVSDLVRPGSLWLEGDLLYVANAGSQEIRRYRMHKRGIDEPEAFATFATGDQNTPVNQPCCFVRDGDGFIAAFNDATGRHGVITRIDNGGNVEPIPVAGLGNPVALARLGDAVLVVDEERMQVLKVAADGAASVFGDESFRNALGEGASLRTALRVAGPVLVVLAALLAAFGGSWLVQRLAQRRPDPALVLHANADGIRWLPRESDRAGVHLPVAIAVAAPLALLPALAAGWLGQAGFGALWALLVLGGAAARPVIAAARARLPNDLRVGTRNRHLVVADTDKGLREFPLPQVEWDDSELRPAPDLSIPLVRNGVALFHAPTVAAALLPQLAPTRRITR